MVTREKKRKGKPPANPFPKGIGGNPRGRPKLPEDIAKARTMRKETFERACTELWNANENDVDKILRARKTIPMHVKIVARMFKAASLGDDAYTKELLVRTIGRVPVDLDVSGNIAVAYVDVVKALEERKKQREALPIKVKDVTEN